MARRTLTIAIAAAVALGAAALLLSRGGGGPVATDEFVMLTSGGHRGTIMLYGIPSMRMLKEIPVYAPDSWQGWQQGETGSMEVVKKGS